MLKNILYILLPIIINIYKFSVIINNGDSTHLNSPRQRAFNYSFNLIINLI